MFPINRGEPKLKDNYAHPILGPTERNEGAEYIPTFVMSPIAMSLPLLIPKTRGQGCARFKSRSLLSHFLLILQILTLKIIHQIIQTTRLHASRCHHRHLSQC